MEHLLEAQVIDSHHLKLKRPIEIAPGSTVLITIETVGGIGDEQEWYWLSAQSLADAYGVDEPDHPVDLIKNPNFD